MRFLFALPGLHYVNRGAEIAFEAIAQEIALEGEHDVLLIGSGRDIPNRAYGFERVPAIPRERFERWPKMPFLRNEYMYEELTFAAGLLSRGLHADADVTITCGYPYLSWALRTRLPGRHRSAHVFVTQNGDWPAFSRHREYRFFSCDGLVCTNPIYYERNRGRWYSTLIPNGFDPAKFHRGTGDRARFGLPEGRPIVLIVSALTGGKRVLEGIRAVARISDVFCVVAGDGPLRNEVDGLAAELLPNRFLRRTFPHEQMPGLYRSANLLLHMAIRESFGNIYVEALASGTPIVAHDDEVTRWILEEHAQLVDTRSEEVLVEAMNNVLRSPLQSTTKGAAFALSRYSWSAVAARYRDFFVEVFCREG